LVRSTTRTQSTVRRSRVRAVGARQLAMWSVNVMLVRSKCAGWSDERLREEQKADERLREEQRALALDSEERHTVRLRVLR
jgi:hypothetical protein